MQAFVLMFQHPAMGRGPTPASTSWLPHCILRRLADRANAVPVGPGLLCADPYLGQSACGQQSPESRAGAH